MPDAAPGAVSPPAPGIVHFAGGAAEDAADVLHRFYHPVSLGMPENADTKIGMEVIQLGPLTVGHLTFTGRVTLAAPAADAYHVTLPVAGRVLARRGGREVTAGPATAVAFRPGDPVYLRPEAPSTEIDLRIEHWALESELAALLGHPIEGTIDLPATFALTGGPAHSWARLIHLVHTELEHRSSLIFQPLIAEHLCSSVLSGLLLSVPHRYHDELVAPAAAGPPRSIRRVLDVIHDEPDRAFTVADLAAIARTSVRSLQEGFRRHVGCTPMAYLQQTRLTRAHEALRVADPAVVTVAAVAHRWGFAHLGRFASAYRTRFGVSPSETLRRAG
ncbi:AraC family transcriptional regulator [Actinoplanes sp. SE50]|uniref:AraC family transcriptional regulator n=1 Tax=unclassified Actinoplanes TaxID=2626549 RepID=UPI00023EE022|nr:MULTISPECIES: AraC family transcriptional regulator [unclassified Actinoplanes]AEV88388.1 XylDLEGF operon transcriptional activator 3 [Actinoplanes sp. SE50/110]ATO86793.1 AraC family transcriptional regulator [Actinoplanes sp. SE50]SLM04211.1 AraC family transcriptional regulator [Actinoplanes sp. SE50/110]